VSRIVPVSKDVRLEVLDWGGQGHPLVLLSGLGNTAHVFDDIAPKLTGKFHVYGITRRGFGASSAPKTGYSADELGNDVMAVLKAMNIERPILAGHSIAGEELSSIGTRFPEQVAGLVYLDAAHEYAFYNPQHGGYLPDFRSLREQVDRLLTDPDDKKEMEALASDLAALQRSLNTKLAHLKFLDASTEGAPSSPPADQSSFPAFRCFVSAQLGGAIPEDETRQTFATTGAGGVGEARTPDFVYNAILLGEQKYDAPKGVPVLAIVPSPRALDLPVGRDPAKRKAAEDLDAAGQEAEIAFLQQRDPAAEIVRVPHGHHYVFLSNEEAVVSAIITFGENLK
jgi:pimeloyl-ACP methyl ester carboxylesterase